MKDAEDRRKTRRSSIAEQNPCRIQDNQWSSGPSVSVNAFANIQTRLRLACKIHSSLSSFGNRNADLNIMGLLASFLRCRCLEPSEKRGAAAATAVTDAAALTSGRDARELRGAERAAPGAAAADRAAESDLPKGAKE